MTLTRDQILAKRAELPRLSVDVPELGGEILIRTLTLKEVREVQKIQKTISDNLAIYPKLISLACINEDGSPLFVGEDIKLIEDQGWPAMDRLAKEVLFFNKMADRPEEGDDPKP